MIHPLPIGTYRAARWVGQASREPPLSFRIPVIPVLTTLSARGGKRGMLVSGRFPYKGEVGGSILSAPITGMPLSSPGSVCRSSV